MDRESVDFGDSMRVALERLGDVEQRGLDTLLSDVLAADSDVVRVRVVHPDASTGQLGLNDDVNLRRGLRRALLAAASSVVNPTTHHPKMSRANAVALLDKCRAGQTERGSYVVKVACPLFAVEENLDHELPPFTRRTSTLLMRAISGLVNAIEQVSVAEFLEVDAAAPTVSSNLCDALVRMHPDREDGDLEISTTWSSNPSVTPPGRMSRAAPS